MITPTYRPDYDLFRELHESVLQFTGDDVMHYAIVPARDAGLFSTIRSGRLTVATTSDFLPRRYLSTYAAARAVRRMPGLTGLPPVQAVNLRRPWPPIRGWILQQVVKLAAASTLDAEVVLAVDSDVSFIRPVTAGLFRRDGATRFYRRTDAVHDGMPDHLVWHDTARKLLGLPPGGPSVGHDYIAPMVALDVGLLHGLRDRIESRQGRNWIDAMTSELHFSEYILYGTYVDELAPARARTFASESSRCHSRWGSEPLTPDDASAFVRSLTESDVAVHVQSTSQADPQLRSAVVRSARTRFQT